MFRPSPGPCPICGAAHTTCVADSGPIAVVQLPARDAAAVVTGAAPVPQGVMSDVVSSPPLGDGTDGRPFATATYRGPKDKKKQRA